MRCIFDTNTLISAIIFPNSIPGRAFNLALSRDIVLISAETITELYEVITRPKFDPYLTIEEREEFLESLLIRSELIEVLEESQICRDPKDDKFLNLAKSGAANYLVTGDKDLLILQNYSGTRILNARDFLDLVIE
ncbi:MAG: putative toxin-antitoxin system toxin component, PIN family [Limnospira sp.]